MSTTTKKPPTLAEYKRWVATTGGKLTRNLVKAMAFAKAEEARVNAYILPLFHQFGLCDADGVLIPEPGRVYLCPYEDAVARYFAECDKAHRAHGFTGPEGHCPHLIAETEKTKAEWELLKAAGAVFGFDWQALYGDTRERMLKLLLEPIVG